LSFYRGTKVLVTGGGFLASNLVAALLEKGAAVRVAGRRPRPRHYGDAVEYLQGDLLDSAMRARALRGIELVFHLAAVGWGLHENLRHQAELLTANLLLNTLMLDHAYRAGVRGYLYASSSAVYPGCLEELAEDAPWHEPPHRSEATFGWAKRMGELQARAYYEQCRLPVAIVRPANPYGLWDNFEPQRSHVIPALIRRAEARDNPFMVWGSGRPVRSFIFAADAALLMLLALESAADCRPINIASPQTVTIAELVRLVLDASGHHGAELVFDTDRPDGHPRKIPSVRRAAELGMKDYTPLRLGLQRTIQWYRQAKEGGRV
jgi:GDP-L-fucose synthase